MVGTYGPKHSAATEPGVAAASDVVVSVFFAPAGYSSRHRAWYAAYNKQTHLWASGEIDPNTPFEAIVDLSIACDSHDGGFLACALAGVDILTCRFEPGPVSGEVTPRQWESAHHSSPGFSLDKPWIVAGDPDMPAGQEYYVVYMIGSDADDFGYGYLRSVNGGESWDQGPIKFASSAELVRGQFCAQPTVDGDGPLYVAYAAGNTIQFLMGQDANPGGPGGVEFSRLCKEPGEPGEDPPPVVVTVNRTYQLNLCIPGNFDTIGGRVPQLAVDPSNPNRLCIVYHDTPTSDPGDKDLNVYLHMLTKTGEYWELGPKRQINDPLATTYESDQFMPSPIVDKSGRIHVIYVDDQKHTDGPEGDLQPDTMQNPKFDVFYAWSEDQGQNWSYRELFATPPEPALDCVLQHFTLREYIGIAWYTSGSTSEIWTAFPGTYTLDPQAKDAVIWSSLIDWSE